MTRANFVSSFTWLAASGALILAVAGGATTDASYSSWWAPNSGASIPTESDFSNPNGTLQLLMANGPFETKGHPFFEPIGTNGRACVTCHQPSDAMSLSAETARNRWSESGGKDPLFAAYDGSNCPNLPQQNRASHSLLINKGLIRVAMDWPPRDKTGRLIEPEFKIEVVSDPTGCNNSSDYGLSSKHPVVSVFRRPRMVANMRFVEPDAPNGNWQLRSGEVLPRDPETGKRLAGNLMADGRAETLREQMGDAFAKHLEGKGTLSRSDQDKIRSFEMQVFAAQSSHKHGGSLHSGGANLGPHVLVNAKTSVLALTPLAPTFPELDGWRTKTTVAAINWPPLVPSLKDYPVVAARPDQDNETPEQRRFRDSVARGYDLFMYRTFMIRDVGSLNPITGNPFKNTCADCHNMQRTGMDNAPGYLGLGTTNYPTATPAPDLPLFKLTCSPKSAGHRYLGRVIYTSDPGRALVTGKCADIGAITAQQMRGLSARAPYFAGGSAATLADVIDFYDRRFRIGFSAQEREDLINFLSVL